MDQQVNATGRPRKDGTVISEGQLYAVLRQKLPTEYVHEDKVNARMLANTAGVARFTVYRWFQKDKLSTSAIGKLLTISENAQRLDEKGRLTKDDLYPFLDI